MSSAQSPRPPNHIDHFLCVVLHGCDGLLMTTAGQGSVGFSLIFKLDSGMNLVSHCNSARSSTLLELIGIIEAICFCNWHNIKKL